MPPPRGNARTRGNNVRGPRGTGSNTGRRNLELIASVSRSSGLEKDGDALKDFRTQEEYREFIQEKLDHFWMQYPYGQYLSASASQRRTELQENTLILFRKLREGVVSSKRHDEFALEVYETSLYLSVMYQNFKQSSSIIPYLLPDIYDQSPQPHPNLIPTILVCLMHELVVAYPSQNTHHHLLRIVSRNRSYLDRSSEAYRWVSSVSSSLRSRNYTRFEILTRIEAYSSFFKEEHDISRLSIQPQAARDLSRKAIISLIHQIRSKFRDTIWTVLRSAYRELACHEGSVTREWLIRSLVLESPTSESDDGVLVDRWLEEKDASGHVRKKEGIADRWIVTKVR
ncbi:pre-mrna-splicing factor cwc22 [Moniliophthora roreri MCA 2997]|uniref:Pre-mrna-splicing factor cwc22 n=2 Tax=Moniliophthora roreri TaxID=221103 RepID=V2XNC1_MONRO|nr:pre-mrna-splicing factor cwc22 [Moniliophthora roreri MCA 2997]KAI3616100.1 pre-mrna-splicing factor cwc22 [Moniliophthora roreri]